MSGAWLARRRIDQRDRCALVVLGTRFLGTSVWAAAGAGCAASRGRAGSAAGPFVGWLGGARLFATGRWRRSPLLSQGRDGAAAAPTLPPRNWLLCLALSVGWNVVQ